MLRRTALALPALALTAILATACAAGGPSTPGAGQLPGTSEPGSTPTSPSTQRSPLSSTDLPTLRPPTAPASTFTDNLPTDLIVGTITAGGSGPCYSLETNDGRRYALYSDAGTMLSRGATVRVWFEPVTANCGAGTPVKILKVEIVQ